MARIVSEKVWGDLLRSLSKCQGHLRVELSSDGPGMTVLKQELAKEAGLALDQAIAESTYTSERD